MGCAHVRVSLEACACNAQVPRGTKQRFVEKKMHPITLENEELKNAGLEDELPFQLGDI